MQSSDVPSDFTLTSFSLWFSLSEAEQRREAESLYVLVHRPVQLFPAFGLRDGTRWQLPTRSCFVVGCDRCLNGRSGYRFQWVGPWTCLHGRAGDPATARQQWRECRDPRAEQSIIVHEQRQPPWRFGLCSYKDNEAEARVPPLARAEEVSGSLWDRGGSARRHEAQGALFAASSYMDRRIIAATTSSLVCSWPLFSVRPLSRVSGIRPGKHNQLSSNSDVSDTVDIGRRLRETSTSFEMERLICASFAPAVTASHQVPHPKKTGYLTFNAQSHVLPDRLKLIATCMIDKNIQVAGLQGTRLGGGRKEYRIRASPLDTKSAQFVVFQWGYGATSLRT